MGEIADYYIEQMLSDPYFDEYPDFYEEEKDWKYTNFKDRIEIVSEMLED